MDRVALENRINELKAKQDTIEKAWRKRDGNNELLQFFVEVMPKAMEAERCSIFVLDPVNDKVWLHSGTGLKERSVEVPKSSSLVGRVIGDGKAIIENEMEAHVGAHDVVALHTGFSVRNAVCVPVHGVTTQRITGAIQVLNKRGRGVFDGDDQKTLEKLAFLLQMNIENIFLRQELGRLITEMDKQIKMMEKQLGK